LHPLTAAEGRDRVEWPQASRQAPPVSQHEHDRRIAYELLAQAGVRQAWPGILIRHLLETVLLG
jgi:hypothetical protein